MLCPVGAVCAPKCDRTLAHAADCNCKHASFANSEIGRQKSVYSAQVCRYAFEGECKMIIRILKENLYSNNVTAEQWYNVRFNFFLVNEKLHLRPCP